MERVFVVDDDAQVRDLLAMEMLEVGYAIETFADAAEFLRRGVVNGPSVAVVDMLLPGMPGLALCRQIIELRMSCSFVLMSGHADVRSAVDAMRLGAVDVLEKPFGSPQLLQAVSQGLQAARFALETQAKRESACRRWQRLTPREREILDAVASGLVTKVIAKRLALSPRTVDVHRSRIMHKLQIESPLQLAHFLSMLKSANGRWPS